MSRNNEERFGAHGDAGSDPVAAMPNPLDFVSPTEHVELPSEGRGYPEGHPLQNKETIEIKYMTAKEEDILSSRSLLKKGLAIERLIDSIICNRNLSAKDILIGDRNAILIAARRSAYGNIYSTKVTCPNCATVSEYEFDLNNAKIYSGGDIEQISEKDIQLTPEGFYTVTLPMTKFVVVFKLLKGEDEVQMIQKIQKKSKKNAPEKNVSQQLESLIVSVNGYKQNQVISHAATMLPAKDAIYLRDAYKIVTPDIKITEDFTCPSCDFEKELEVPFGADFFWPDR